MSRTAREDGCDEERRSDTDPNIRISLGNAYAAVN
jgi:hypothetical protein